MEFFRPINNYETTLSQSIDLSTTTLAGCLNDGGYLEDVLIPAAGAFYVYLALETSDGKFGLLRWNGVTLNHMPDPIYQGMLSSSNSYPAGTRVFATVPSKWFFDAENTFLTIPRFTQSDTPLAGNVWVPNVGVFFVGADPVTILPDQNSMVPVSWSICNLAGADASVTFNLTDPDDPSWVEGLFNPDGSAFTHDFTTYPNVIIQATYCPKPGDLRIFIVTSVVNVSAAAVAL